MKKISLRPPLPPPLRHEGITFVQPSKEHTDTLTSEIVAAIAVGLSSVVPPGDFVITSDGRLVAPTGSPSAWLIEARLTGVDRYPQ
jgi:hypothetical protein